MTMRFVLLPSDEAPDSRFGGKGATLRHLLHDGLPVPAFAAVTAEAFDASIALATVDFAARTALAGTDAAARQRVLANLQPAPQVVEEIRRALAAILPDGGSVAVRASAPDGADADGLLDSVLAVAPGDVPAAVARVWRSAWGERPITRCRERGLGLPRPPAVLLQRMVDADAAGLASAVDAVEGRWDAAVVTAVWGLGSAQVAGAADADVWHVDRSGAILLATIATKGAAHRAAPGTPDGVATVPVTPEQATRPVLDDAQAARVAALARHCSRLRSRPQDIAWALAGDDLWLLQARPIVGLGQVADPMGAPALWSDAVAEGCQGPVTPLTASFIRRCEAVWHRRRCQLLGASERALARHETLFPALTGVIRSRLFTDLLAWRRTLDLLPRHAAERLWRERPHADLPPLPRTPLIIRLLGLDRLRSLAATWHHRRSFPGLLRRFRRALAEPCPEPDDLRPDELAAACRDQERLLADWDAPLLNAWLADEAVTTLRRLCRRWLPEAGDALVDDLLGGEEDLDVLAPVFRMQELAALTAGSAAFGATLRTAPLAAIRAAMRERKVFSDGVAAFIADFGDRCPAGLKFESPTLADDPLPLFRAIGHAALRLATTERAVRARAEAEARMAEALARHPLHRRRYLHALRRARERFRLSHDMAGARITLTGRVRRLLLELGRRLAATGALDDAADVLWLDYEELLGFVQGTTICDDLRGLVAVRRAAGRRHRAVPAPDGCFPTRGAVWLGNAFAVPAADHGGGDTRSGRGRSAGQVRGRVRMVSDPGHAVIDAGDILVAEYADPGWILLLPACGGLLVERDGVDNGLAAIARELGIPAIVAVPGLAAWLADGDEVLMDGGTGTVERLAQGSPSE